MNKEQIARIPRYAYQGGFTVSFNPGYRITIEIVCAGFDCHETRRHLTWHERFTIPWERIDEIDKTNGLEQPAIKKELASLSEYRKSAKRRLDYLVDGHGYDEYPVLEFLPMKEYEEVSPTETERILSEIILPGIEKIEAGDYFETVFHGDFVAGTIVPRKHKHRKPRSKNAKPVS